MNTGGPAFPGDSSEKGQSFAYWKKDDKDKMSFLVVSNPGLSIRDYFAAKAMQGILANPSILSSSGELNVTNVAACFAISDAMLEEREKSK